MKIHSINTPQNNKVAFQANPKVILTTDAVKSMPAEDILEFSVKTLENQDIDVVRAVCSKINAFIQVLTSKWAYIKKNEIEFSLKEIDKTKANKKKAQKIEKALHQKILEEKTRILYELCPEKMHSIPIEYIILPAEEKNHRRVVKYDDLLTDKIDADRYKRQWAKHDRNTSKHASAQMYNIYTNKNSTMPDYGLDSFALDREYKDKKEYNKLAEKILFAKTKLELGELRKKIFSAEYIDDWSKNALTDLLTRRLNQLK